MREQVADEASRLSRVAARMTVLRTLVAGRKATDITAAEDPEPS